MAKSCTYNDQEYSHGSVSCQGGREYRCNDGEWDSLNTPCGNTITVASAVFDAPLPGDARGAQCISIFNAGALELGLRNNCNRCMLAVVFWSGSGTPPPQNPAKYRVEAYGTQTVKMPTTTGQLIGDEPC